MEDPDESLRRLMEARVGTTLCGRYTLDELIGIGGMAAVYRGHHRNGNRVAVKVLHLELSAAPHIKGRFLREGYVANKVDHPGSVRVLDDDIAEDGAVFLVMELLEGETLESRIARRNGKLAADEAVPILIKTLEVLEAAHAKQIVHRDIKPENVFLLRGGGVKLLDFGIARLLDGSRGMTRTGHFVGTPAYMAPEQARGEKDCVGPTSDLWSVGATAFKTMSGRFVHEAPSPEMTMIQTATSSAPSLVSVAPSVTRELSDIVDRALALDIEDRWPSARQMADALGRWLDRRSHVVPKLFEDPPSSNDSEDHVQRILARPSDLPAFSLEEQTRVDADEVTQLRETGDALRNARPANDAADPDADVETTVDPHPPALDGEGPPTEPTEIQPFTLPQLTLFESVKELQAADPRATVRSPGVDEGPALTPKKDVGGTTRKSIERPALPRLQLTDSLDTQTDIALPIVPAFRPHEAPQVIHRREEPTSPRRAAFVVDGLSPPGPARRRPRRWRRILFWSIVATSGAILVALVLVLMRPPTRRSPATRTPTPATTSGADDASGATP